MKTNPDHPLVILSKALPAKVVGVLIFQVAFLVGFLIFGSVVLGIAADRALGTRPLLTLGLGIISLPAAVWLTYRLAMRASANARRHYEEYVESKKNTAESASRPAQSVQSGAPLRADS